MVSLCLCSQLIFSACCPLKIILRRSPISEGKQVNHSAGNVLNGAVCTNEIEDRSSQSAVVAFTECLWYWCWGCMAGVCCMSTGYWEHVSEPQPLNWENPSSSCRGDFGHSYGKAGRRGRAHGQCLVLDWCRLSCGILVLGFCTDAATPGGAQARAKGNNGMVDSVWCRNGLCFQKNKNKSKGGG